MKYALFVLGILLIAAGGYFLFAGSHVIESGRGWSSVIAGTTALTGGIITLALAGVVKGLEDLKEILVSAAAQPQSVVAFATETPVATEADMEMLIAPNLGPAPAGVEPAPPPEAEVPIPVQESPATAPDVLPSPLSKERPRFAPKFAPRSTPAEPAPAIAELRRRVAEDLVLDWPALKLPPLSPAQEPSPAAEEPIEEPAEFYSLPPLHFDDLGEHYTQSYPEGAIEEAEEYAAEEAHENEPLPPPLPETPAAAASLEPAELPSATAEPKAIGRYEAAGTLYVMFSDGSIEAQSPQGTRRFKSMADLKASFQS